MPHRSKSSDLTPLTEKQKYVIKRLAEGQKNFAISVEMGISEKTVEYHRTKAQRKIGCDSLAGLIRFAFRTGLSKL
jgi:DNA-binding CsgD family transcriptional regulator